ncbi:MAG: response regulator [Limnobacter sp.]|nr:response regulator [Limnobacter sp.]
MNKKNIGIALIDDHVLLRNGLASLIQAFEGYTVLFEADNGKDFIHQLGKNTIPDIILLDITMPEMNGYEAVRQIRIQAGTNQNALICALSGLVDSATVDKVLSSGMNRHLSKPVSFEELNTLLGQVAHRVGVESA